MRIRTCLGFAAIAVTAAAIALGCSSREQKSTPAAETEEATTSQEATAMSTTIQLTSPVFENGKPIPVKYTCDGDDVSPELKWGNLPEGTRSIALICDDPDAPMGTWVHWVLFDLPVEVTGLPEAIPGTETLDNGATQGMTNFKRVGYGGPCPPPGKPHRYFFKLYAVDKMLGLSSGADKGEVLSAMEGHVLGEGQLMGTYGR
jgi:Raf kinase inhibitor-like YbhB/YbcL family protein